VKILLRTLAYMLARRGIWLYPGSTDRAGGLAEIGAKPCERRVGGA